MGREHYIAKEYAMSTGVGISSERLPSFDKALLDAGVGNYNLVRLSSILPAHCKEVDVGDIEGHITPGSLLPTAYSTISSDYVGEHIVSTIGVGLPEDEKRVGVIMEFSTNQCEKDVALKILDEMIEEAFNERGWKLKEIKSVACEATVRKPNTVYTTFACIAEW